MHGGDGWFFLQYADALRAQRRFPVRLTRYLLDDTVQVYPPLFGVLLAALPARWRQPGRAAWIAPLIDVVHLGVLALTAHLAGLTPYAIVAACLVYAVIPAVVSEFSALGSRSLASLLLTSFMLALWTLDREPSPMGLAACAVLGGLLLNTHKMAAQLWVVLVVVGAIAARRPAWILSEGVLSIAAAFALSGGFYRSVLRGHARALAFWRQHARDAHAHPVYDSALYPSTSAPRPPDRRLFAPGWRARGRLVRQLLALNPWSILLPWLWSGATSPLERFLLLWATVAFAAALLTTFVPGLRFLGQGSRYLKFTAFPLALLAGSALAATPGMWVAGAFLLGASVFAIRRVVAGRGHERLDPDFLRMLAFVEKRPEGRIAALPAHRCDPLAYFTRKEVLWGLHSAGYDTLAEFFPVLRRPLTGVLDSYGVDLLLIDREYVDPRVLDPAGSFVTLREEGRFLLLKRPPPRTRTG
jgi:hypothetical protein